MKMLSKEEFKIYKQQAANRLLEMVERIKRIYEF
jgi:hypothetical protein